MSRSKRRGSHTSSHPSHWYYPTPPHIPYMHPTHVTPNTITCNPLAHVTPPTYKLNHNYQSYNNIFLVYNSFYHVVGPAGHLYLLMCISLCHIGGPGLPLWTMLSRMDHLSKCFWLISNKGTGSLHSHQETRWSGCLFPSMGMSSATSPSLTSGQAL